MIVGLFCSGLFINFLCFSIREAKIEGAACFIFSVHDFIVFNGIFLGFEYRSMSSLFSCMLLSCF